MESTATSPLDVDFIPRDYQIELFQAALEENIIVYLPTGSGKTFIAALLIKEMSGDVTKPLDSGGKRTVFLVPTIVLAIQQAAYLKRHTHLKVKEFYGSMGVDMWGEDKWRTEFEENNVLVMTAQVFVDILNHAFFTPYQLNLLVFDECHSAVKDAPMKQVLSKLRSCDITRRPKILGLTAALFRMRCKPERVPDIIRQLSEAMGCVVKIPSDIENVYRSSTKPCETIIQYEDDNSGPHSCEHQLHISISAKVFELTEKFQEVYGEGTKNESNFPKHADNIDVLWNALKDLDHLLKVFGLYGAFHCAGVYILILQRAKSRAKDPQFLMDLNTTIGLCQEIREICTPVFAKHSPRDRLLVFVQPRVIRLLQVLRKFKPEQNHEIQISKHKMCCIIFVERRCVANVLYHFLKDIRQHDIDLEFLKPLFTIGQASGRNSSLRESQILNMKQKEIMKKFREGYCNLLVATSVLEEGIDIPACNLIIRFDKIKTYCDYVQTKGRARSTKAFYCMFVSHTDTEACLEDMAQFHYIEQQLVATENFQDDRENFIDSLFSEIIQPYTPFGDEGPRITLLSSISLVNRYCSTLSLTDGTVVLAPKWSLRKIDESVVDPSWLRKIRQLLKQLPDYSPSATNAHLNYDLFQCRLVLPLNSPLREEVTGEVMPTKRLAKRAVALKMCTILHRLKELDDIHLFPINRLELDEDDNLADSLDKNPSTDPQLHQGKNGIYNRRLPACFTDCRPRAGQTSFVYSIDFTLIKPCLDTTKLYFPFAVQTKLAILSSKLIPAICAFPLITRAGEFKVDLCGIDSIILDDRQLEKLEKFHQFLFQDVIFLWKRQLNFDSDVSALQYLIVPLHSATEKIDFHLIEKMINAPIIDWNASPCREQKYDFDATLFVDAVIVPSYKPLGTLNTFYVDCLSDLTPLSPFPNEQYQNYATYFAEKHKLTLTNSEQRLAQVSREITGKNFLIPRETSTKEDFIHLVPELCHVHPLPASIWKQVVWIPSVLHRLMGMLVAEELRLLLCKEAKIGTDFLPGAVNVSTVWCPLRIQQQKKSTRSRGFSSISPDPKRLLESCNPSTLVELLDCDPSLIWNFDYGEVDSPSSVSDSNASGHMFDIEAISETDKPNVMEETTRITPQDACASIEHTDSIDEQKRKWIDLASEPQENSSTCSPELFNLSFDSPNLNTLSLYGPSPGLILEALTLSKAHDGYDMERLETLGDSILKLIISIYVYGETSNQRCDEGRLSLMRTRQINNKHLFALGEKKFIGEFIAAQKFDLMANFLPPAFQTPVANNEPNLHIQQFVSMKNVADCMEALIGVYLLTTGIKGAITVMNWMGLQTMPKREVQVFNEANGIPVLAAIVEPLFPNEMENKELAISHLFAGLELFEKRLSYTFKNKMLLIESLTHPSYLPNRITGCYQRLEFLGDAVLDYLVTRFYYDNPCQYSPAILTDMRSAMVNNQTFAVMAVKNRFHLYLKHLSLSLSLIMDRFIRAQEDNGHLLMHDYFVLEETSDPNEQIASNIDIPKVLGDIFESVAGAIFVDSGMSLDAVWKAYLPFLHDALEKFNENTPISALRVLHERHPNALKFGKSVTLPDGRLCVAVEIDGVHIFKGAGMSLKTAKSAAAKYALSMLNNEKPI